MIHKFLYWFIRSTPRTKRWFWKKWYTIFASKALNPDFRFMNYGYYDEGFKPQLNSTDEKERYPIQLYHHVATQINLEKKLVLEVGSGRGGGAEYIAKNLKPEKITGLDISETAVKLCNSLYDVENLNFVAGDSENLPFPNECFDVVINVESSHCYGNMDAFVKEVFRVLKPGGYFSWVDLRGADMIQALEVALSHPQLQLVRNEIITENVIQALDEIHERKIDLIREYIPKWIQPAFKDFAGVKNSKIYNAFKDGSALYLAKTYQKTRY